MSELSVVERVAAGAEILDRAMPGWAHKIDMSILNITDSLDCILGQLYNGYWHGQSEVKDALDRDFVSTHEWCSWGFDLNDWDAYNEDDLTEYDDLHDAWNAAIMDRINEAENVSETHLH